MCTHPPTHPPAIRWVSSLRKHCHTLPSALSCALWRPPPSSIIPHLPVRPVRCLASQLRPRWPSASHAPSTLTNPNPATPSASPARPARAPARLAHPGAPPFCALTRPPHPHQHPLHPRPPHLHHGRLHQSSLHDTPTVAAAGTAAPLAAIWRVHLWARAAPMGMGGGMVDDALAQQITLNSLMLIRPACKRLGVWKGGTGFLWLPHLDAAVLC